MNSLSLMAEKLGRGVSLLESIVNYLAKQRFANLFLVRTPGQSYLLRVVH